MTESTHPLLRNVFSPSYRCHMLTCAKRQPKKSQRRRTLPPCYRSLILSDAIKLQIGQMTRQICWNNRYCVMPTICWFVSFHLIPIQLYSCLCQTVFLKEEWCTDLSHLFHSRLTAIWSQSFILVFPRPHSAKCALLLANSDRKLPCNFDQSYRCFFRIFFDVYHYSVWL